MAARGSAALWLAVALVISVADPVQAGQSDDHALDEAVEAFWAASSDAEVAAASAAILATDPDIEAVSGRLRAVRSYARDCRPGGGS